MCEDAAKLLGKETLRDATTDEILSLESTFDDAVMFRRVRHVVSEIQRTSDAADALDAGDYETFGRLMIESHFSLRWVRERACPLFIYEGEAHGVGTRLEAPDFQICDAWIQPGFYLKRMAQ